MADRQDDKRSGAGAVSPYAAIFLGVSAAKRLAMGGDKRPMQAMTRAAKLRAAGASEATIYAETNKRLKGSPYAGVSYDAGGNPRFELDDSASRLSQFGLGRDRQGFMGDVLKHPSLDVAMGSDMIPVRHIPRNVKGGQGGGEIVLGNPQFLRPIAGRSVLAPDSRGVLLHELQHAAQDMDNRPRGGDPSNFEKYMPGDGNLEKRRMAYRAIAGEVEAEVTRHSADMTAEQRRQSHPDQRAKDFGLVGRDKQILVDGNGRMKLPSNKSTRAKREAAHATHGGDKLPASQGRFALMADDPIRDFGEKIGGARKDGASKTGPRRQRAATVDTDPRPAWARRFHVMEQIDRVTKTGTGKWSIVDMGQNERYGGRSLMRDIASKEEAEKRLPLAAVARNHRVRPITDAASGETRFEIWRDVTDRKRVKVTPETFATRDDAMRHMGEHAVKIIETKTGFGEEILAKPEKAFRTGPAVRKGDVAGDAFLKDIGARAVEFGNWQGDRQAVVNHAYDAMRDLSHATGIAPKDLSLKGDLAVAFGARGHGLSGARAHYEPRYGAINLTKMEGAGALAHEWFHGLDHMLGRVDEPKLAELDPKSPTKAFKAHAGDGVFASTRVASSPRGELPREVRTAYRELMDSLYRKPEQYVEDASRVEKFQAATHKELAERIAGIRKHLSEPLSYGKRNTKPASADQLARFDAEAAKILKGDALKTDWRSFPTKSRYGSIGRHTNDALEAISGIMKEVRGRSGFDSQDRRGHLDQLSGLMRTHAKRVDMVADAAAQSVKTKFVPTEFSMQARRLDEGRVSDYWQQRHEMAARAFSSYVEDKLAAQSRRSDYLSFGSDNRLYAMLGQKPFPEGPERQAFNAKFDALFSTMRKVGMVQPAPPPAAQPKPVAPKSAPATPPDGGKGPAGWSDEARAASAETRKADAKTKTPKAEKPKRAKAAKAPKELGQKPSNISELQPKTTAKELTPSAAKPASPANVPQGTSEAPKVAPAGPSAAVKAAKAGNVKALASALGTNPTRAADALKRYRSGKLSDVALDKMAPKPSKPSAAPAKPSATVAPKPTPIKAPPAAQPKPVPPPASKPKPMPGKGLIGFQNEATLNAALEAQGKADAGKAKAPKAKAAPKAKIETTSAPKKPRAPRAPRAKAGSNLQKTQVTSPVSLPAAAPKPAAPKPAPAPAPTHATPAIERTAISTPTPKAPISPAVTNTLRNAAGRSLSVATGIAVGAGVQALISADKAHGDAIAAGKTQSQAKRDALTAGVQSGAVSAAVMGAAVGAIKTGIKVAKAIAPKVAPAVLGPAGAALAVGGLAYGAVEGYRKTGTIAGATVGAVSGGEVFEGQKTAAVRSQEGWERNQSAMKDAGWGKGTMSKDRAEAFEKASEGQPAVAMTGGMTRQAAHQFETRDEAYATMQKASQQTGPVEVEEFTRTRRTQGGKMVTENVGAFTRARPGQKASR